MSKSKNNAFEEPAYCLIFTTKAALDTTDLRHRNHNKLYGYRKTGSTLHAPCPHAVQPLHEHSNKKTDQTKEELLAKIKHYGYIPLVFLTFKRLLICRGILFQISLKHKSAEQRTGH
jgi:hypothetical protein